MSLTLILKTFFSSFYRGLTSVSSPNRVIFLGVVTIRLVFPICADFYNYLKTVYYKSNFEGLTNLLAFILGELLMWAFVPWFLVIYYMIQWSFYLLFFVSRSLFLLAFSGLELFVIDLHNTEIESDYEGLQLEEFNEYAESVFLFLRKMWYTFYDWHHLNRCWFQINSFQWFLMIITFVSVFIYDRYLFPLFLRNFSFVINKIVDLIIFVANEILSRIWLGYLEMEDYLYHYIFVFSAKMRFMEHIRLLIILIARLRRLKRLVRSWFVRVLFYLVPKWLRWIRNVILKACSAFFVSLYNYSIHPFIKLYYFIWVFPWAHVFKAFIKDFLRGFFSIFFYLRPFLVSVLIRAVHESLWWTRAIPGCSYLIYGISIYIYILVVGAFLYSLYIANAFRAGYFRWMIPTYSVIISQYLFFFIVHKLLFCCYLLSPKYYNINKTLYKLLKLDFLAWYNLSKYYISYKKISF